MYIIIVKQNVEKHSLFFCYKFGENNEKHRKKSENSKTTLFF